MMTDEDVVRILKMDRDEFEFKYLFDEVIGLFGGSK